MSEEVKEELEWVETEQEAMGRALSGGGLLLGLYWVVFLWSFWDTGFSALGANAALFLVLFIVLHLKIGFQFTKPFFDDVTWELPLFLLAASYALYENPFLKACNLFAVPAMIGFVVLRKSARNPESLFASGVQTVILIFYTVVGPVGQIQLAIASVWGWFTRGGVSVQKFSSQTTRSVLKGLLIFVLLAGFLIVPLLSSADATFAAAFEEIYLFFEEIIVAIFEKEFFWKVIFLFFCCGGDSGRRICLGD